MLFLLLLDFIIIVGRTNQTSDLSATIHFHFLHQTLWLILPNSPVHLLITGTFGPFYLHVSGIIAGFLGDFGALVVVHYPDLGDRHLIA